MAFMLHIPVVVSFMMLAAHFVREGQTLLVILSLLFTCLLFYKKVWTVRLVQLALIAGVFEWVITLAELRALRLEHGLPWVRLTLIMGGVALFTGCSAVVFLHTSIKRKYGLGPASKNVVP